MPPLCSCPPPAHEGHFIDKIDTALDSLDLPTFDGLTHPQRRVYRGVV
jgi:hypothetical protein